MRSLSFYTLQWNSPNYALFSVNDVPRILSIVFVQNINAFSSKEETHKHSVDEMSELFSLR